MVNPLHIHLWPLVLYFACIVAVVVCMIWLSSLLGEHHRGRSTGEIYESGLVSTGSAHVRFAAKFYLVAMVFVIFDLEAAFIYLYAVSFSELAWTGYIEINIFIAVLIVALLWLWRNGALDWGTVRHLNQGRNQQTDERH
jgi:NADH-quinone oxidoreductase subunit A